MSRKSCWKERKAMYMYVYAHTLIHSCSFLCFQGILSKLVQQVLWLQSPPHPGVSLVSQKLYKLSQILPCTEVLQHLSGPSFTFRQGVGRVDFMQICGDSTTASILSFLSSILEQRASCFFFFIEDATWSWRS